MAHEYADAEAQRDQMPSHVLSHVQQHQGSNQDVLDQGQSVLTMCRIWPVAASTYTGVCTTCIARILVGLVDSRQHHAGTWLVGHATFALSHVHRDQRAL